MGKGKKKMFDVSTSERRHLARKRGKNVDRWNRVLHGDKFVEKQKRRDAAMYNRRHKRR